MLKIWRTSVCAAALVLGAALLLATLPGCGSGIPTTYPVKGRVVWKGGKSVRYGRIEFHSLSDQGLKAIGALDEEGTFSLITHKEGKTRKGAVAGQHHVLVEPYMGPYAPPLVVPFPNPYTVEPKENDFTIEVTPRRR
jgi:hypothetical protein